MAQFGIMNPVSVQFDLVVDPAGNKSYPLWRAPVGATVAGFAVVAASTQAAGSAVQVRVVNFGTGGSAIKPAGGTVTAPLGGTAADARLTAGVPARTTQTVNPYLEAGEWLALELVEQGGGWHTGDVLRVQVDVVAGKMGENAAG